MHIVAGNPFNSHNLSNYWARVATFSNWKYQNGPCASHELAKSGFYCTSKTCARCYYCTKELQWESSDIPHVEHRKHSPRCPFVVKYANPPRTITLQDMLFLERERLIYAAMLQRNELQLIDQLASQEIPLS